MLKFRTNFSPNVRKEGRKQRPRCLKIEGLSSSVVGGSNPGMLENLVGGVALKGIDLKHPGYQLLGRVGDLVPVRGVELKESAQNLIKQLLLVVGPG